MSRDVLTVGSTMRIPLLYRGEYSQWVERKAAGFYKYETFKATEGELLLDTYIRYLQVINDLKKSKEKVVVSSDSERSKADDFSELKKITALVKYYNCEKEGHFAKDFKKVKVKDYEYYKTKMLLTKKDKDEQVFLAKEQAWMESSRYTSMFLTHSDEALEIEKFKRSRENKIKFAYDYGNLNASYVNEKINLEDDYFQEIINPYFDKIDSPFQQTSSLKPYVLNVILEKIIIDLEDEV
nr:hypothetical protein [Tanacetum cinerariifolium]